MDEGIVSTGHAGRWIYLRSPIHDHLAAQAQRSPRSVQRVYCSRNGIAVAGWVPHEPDGSSVEWTIGNGFLNKPTRAQHDR
jgi:hypothetical protein